jgi:hypothetical protein
MAFAAYSRRLGRRAGGGGATPLVLDGLSAALALSTRLLRTAYGTSAPLMDVRRSSDNAVAAIPSKLYAPRAYPYWLDEDALLAHCGAGSGFVSAWYDQESGARHLAQATLGSQPRIVNAGVVEKVNSVPALIFDGTDDYLFNALPFMYDAGAVTAMMVAKITLPVSANQYMLFCESNHTDDDVAYNFRSGGTGNLSGVGMFIRNDASSQRLSEQFANAALDNTLRAISFREGSGLVSAFNNGAENAGDVTTAYSRVAPLTTTRFVLGALIRTTVSNHISASISELIVFASSISNADFNTVGASQGEAYGITVNPI